MAWGNHRRWRDLLLGIALLMGVAACTWQGIKPEGETTRRLYITGAAPHVDDERIAEIAASYLDASFFDVDIERLQSELTALAWLREVNVARHWPDGVVIRVAEHVPVARWRDDRLLSAQGEVFEPDTPFDADRLPRFEGPAGTGAQVLAQYDELVDVLSGSGVALVALSLDSRGSWQARLDNGLELRLGRDAVEARAQRFVRYGLGDSRARDRLAGAGYVDLRYSDGFAIGGTRAAAKNRETDDEQAA